MNVARNAKPAASPAPPRDDDTWLAMEDGKEQLVGRFEAPPNLPPVNERCSHHVFISHAGLGEGGVKKKIARPAK